MRCSTGEDASSLVHASGGHLLHGMFRRGVQLARRPRRRRSARRRRRRARGWRDRHRGRGRQLGGRGWGKRGRRRPHAGGRDDGSGGQRVRGGPRRRRRLLHLLRAILRLHDRERLEQRDVDDRRAQDHRGRHETRPERRRLRHRGGRNVRRDGPRSPPRVPRTRARGTSSSARPRPAERRWSAPTRTMASWSTRAT